MVAAALVVIQALAALEVGLTAAELTALLALAVAAVVVAVV